MLSAVTGLLAYTTGLYFQKDFLVLLLKAEKTPEAMVRLEGFGELERNSLTSAGLEPATFRLVTWRLMHLHHRVPLQILIAFIYDGA
jgi:hypothetical protein